MGYKMFEIIQEEKDEILEHAEQAYEHIGKMIECVEKIGKSGMGQRDGDEWYIRQMQRGGYGGRDEMGYHDEMGYREDMMGERRGVRGTGRYGMRMGYREPTPYYRNY